MSAVEEVAFVAVPGILETVAVACYNDPDARDIADKVNLVDYEDADPETQQFWRFIAATALNAVGHMELCDALRDAANVIQNLATGITDHGSSPELRAKQAVLQDQANAAFAALAKARGQ